MSKSLLLLTKFVLGVSAVVQIIAALAGLFTPDLSSQFLYPPPLEHVPVLAMRFFGAFYLSSALGALMALRVNNWSAARTYLSISGPFVFFSAVLSIIAALSPGGIPLIFWLYVVLSLIYLPLVFVCWRQESARNASA